MVECVIKIIVRIRNFLEFILAVIRGVDVKRGPVVRFETSNNSAAGRKRKCTISSYRNFGLGPCTHKTTPRLPFTLPSFLAY
jgi:hypothetical protein